MTGLKKAARALLDFLEAEDDPQEPVYDPVQLGAALVVTLAVAGALYWLLWTLLVYENGLFVKLSALLTVLLTDKTPADYGWKGPHDRGVFEGFTANALALLITGAVTACLHKLYFKKASRDK